MSENCINCSEIIYDDGNIYCEKCRIKTNRVFKNNPMTETNQPAPLYRLHFCKDKLPEKDGIYNTNFGIGLYREAIGWNAKSTPSRTWIAPEWWFEETEICTKNDWNLEHEAFVTEMKINDHESIYAHLQMAFKWFRKRYENNLFLNK